MASLKIIQTATCLLSPVVKTGKVFVCDGRYIANIMFVRNLYRYIQSRVHFTNWSVEVNNTWHAMNRVFHGTTEFTNIG